MLYSCCDLFLLILASNGCQMRGMSRKGHAEVCVRVMKGQRDLPLRLK